MSDVLRNEAGDRLDGAPNPPIKPPPPAAIKGLPPGATGYNEAGDPVFPLPPVPKDLEPEKKPEVRGPKPWPCAKCGGRKRTYVTNSFGTLIGVACQPCGGTGRERRK